MDNVRQDPWDEIVSEYSPFIGQVYQDHWGNRYRFFGLVLGEDDYYYGMSSIPGNVVHLLSCVGHLGEKGHGFTIVPPSSERKCWTAYSPMSARPGLY